MATNIATNNARQNDINPPLPERRLRAAETFILQYQEREHELERLRISLDERDTTIHKLVVEIEGLKSQWQSWQLRAEDMTADRDTAVARYATLESLLLNIFGTLKQAGLPLEQPQQDGETE